MAFTTAGDKKWKKRRLSLAKAEKMRVAKRAEASSPLSPMADLTSTQPSPDTPLPSTQPGPSGLQQVTPADETYSSNLTDEGESSSNESDFDDEKAQDVFDDWMVSLRSDDRKLLSVALLQAFNTRQGMLVSDGCREGICFIYWFQREDGEALQKAVL